tara:strand:- start:271 stop:1281 length:1011 start_codon:yes stop_codon:yes gene_type:complete
LDQSLTNFSKRRQLDARLENWQFENAFTISRGTRTTTEVIVVAITEDEITGRGECVPYSRYGESPSLTLQTIESIRADITAGITVTELQELLPAGAARNAVDCALWDLSAKKSGKSVWEILGINQPGPCTTAYTLSLDTPEAMGRAALEASHRPLLKLKLGTDGDADRVKSVRRYAPNSRIIIDANEGWTSDTLEALAPILVAARVELVEQPLPAGEDDALTDMNLPIAICADESCHDCSTLSTLPMRYDYINIKLDKTGGLSEAIAMTKLAKTLKLKIMVGCMVGTSLAMAPAHLITQFATFIDLDGPLLLANDRTPGIVYNGSEMQTPPSELWG